MMLSDQLIILSLDLEPSQTSISVEIQGHGDADDSEGDAVSHDNVLSLAQKAVLFHDVGDL